MYTCITMEAYIDTYIKTRKKWRHNYNIYIFDTGERLTISFIPTSNKETLINAFKNLYMLIDVELEQSLIEDTLIDDVSKDFLSDTIKNIYEEDDYKKSNFRVIKEQILSIIAFEKILKSCGKCKKSYISDFNANRIPAESTRQSRGFWNDTLLSDANKVIKNNSEPLDNIQAYDYSALYHPVDLYDENTALNNIQIYNDEKTNMQKDESVVLFNSIYNISIVIKPETLTIVPDDFSSIFTEWKVISVIENNEKYFNELNDKFNIKSYDSYDIVVKKMQTFIDYYEINTNADIVSNTNTSTEPYKVNKADSNTIKKVLLSKYTINNNEENRVKSLFLIEEIMKLLKTYNYVYTKSSLPGLFLECGLKKKRYSDGIYYYGLLENKREIEELSKTE